MKKVITSLLLFFSFFTNAQLITFDEGIGHFTNSLTSEGFSFTDLYGLETLGVIENFDGNSATNGTQHLYYRYWSPQPSQGFRMQALDAGLFSLLKFDFSSGFGRLGIHSVIELSIKGFNSLGALVAESNLIFDDFSIDFKSLDLNRNFNSLSSVTCEMVGNSPIAHFDNLLIENVKVPEPPNLVLFGLVLLVIGTLKRSKATKLD